MATEQLYRWDETQVDETTRVIASVLMRDLVNSGGLVPVEPCVHGRIDAHWGPHYVADASGHDREYREWCKGAMELDRRDVAGAASGVSVRVVRYEGEGGV